MMNLEVLVAAMGQTDCSLADKMNLNCPAVIANQCGRWGYEEQGSVRMISNDTKGVGVNRNLALELARGDILLFADDDIVYYDSDLRGVTDAFRQFPDADVIFFAVDMTKNGQVFDKRRNKARRVYLWNSLRYGACRMAVRREAIVKKRLRFSTLFGGGCLYCSGEDTIFIRDCARAGLKMYSHDYVLGACAKDTSTWFRGYTPKYFFDRGAMIACAFPRAKHLVKWHFALKLTKKSGTPLMRILRLMNDGIRAFATLTPYTTEGETP